MLSTPTPSQPPLRAAPSPPPDSDDGGSSKFGELEPLWDSVLKLPSEGITRYDRDNVYDVVNEMYTPIFPGDRVGDKACWLKYLKEIKESDGFDIIVFPGCGPLTTIFPMTPSKETKDFAEQALELYNEDNDTKYKVNEILKVNGCYTQYFHFYITFTVTNGEHEYFQAEVRKDVDESLECAIIRPRISDFGLAKLCLKPESSMSMLGPRGTISYTAPEMVCRNLGGVSHKSDVYSYGMMVLEMVVRKKKC
ncbi:hypothetical protein BC332_27216 [Capsicum chinense]|nr:hypothetical protein BC332_27216 [Capsicum chinense]